MVKIILSLHECPAIPKSLGNVHKNYQLNDANWVDEYRKTTIIYG